MRGCKSQRLGLRQGEHGLLVAGGGGLPCITVDYSGSRTMPLLKRREGGRQGGRVHDLPLSTFKYFLTFICDCVLMCVW